MKASLLTRIKCVLLGHDWDMYRGYGEIYPHSMATCTRCGQIPSNN